MDPISQLVLGSQGVAVVALLVALWKRHPFKRRKVRKVLRKIRHGV